MRIRKKVGRLRLVVDFWNNGKVVVNGRTYSCLSITSRIMFRQWKKEQAEPTKEASEGDKYIGKAYGYKEGDS